MVHATLSAVLRHMRRLAESNAATGQDDRTLLERFINHRDESAFAALVQCHGGMVLRVCRGVLRHEHDAEDAFQATFLVLARKARVIRKKGALASWLFGVARRTALKAKHALGRRSGQPPPGPGPAPEQPPSAAALRELQAILDDEVERLPEKYRTKVKIVTGVLFALVVVAAVLGASGILHQTQAADASKTGNNPKANKAAGPKKATPDAEVKRLTKAVKTAFEWGQHVSSQKLHEQHAKNGQMIIGANKCTACHAHPFTGEKRESDRWKMVSVAQDSDKVSDYVLIVLKRQRPKGDPKEPKGKKK